MRGVGRVRQRPKQVEDRPDTKACADGGDMAHRRMVAAREEETNTGLVETILKGLRCDVEFDAKCFEDIGRPGFWRDRPVAMLSDTAASCCNDDGAGC